jgi:hypothetical protein
MVPGAGEGKGRATGNISRSGRFNFASRPINFLVTINLRNILELLLTADDPRLIILVLAPAEDRNELHETRAAEGAIGHVQLKV